jgi:hypothetical protein
VPLLEYKSISSIDNWSTEAACFVFEAGYFLEFGCRDPWLVCFGVLVHAVLAVSPEVTLKSS